MGRAVMDLCTPRRSVCEDRLQQLATPRKYVAYNEQTVPAKPSMPSARRGTMVGPPMNSARRAALRWPDKVAKMMAEVKGLAEVSDVSVDAGYLAVDGEEELLGMLAGTPGCNDSYDTTDQDVDEA